MTPEPGRDSACSQPEDGAAKGRLPILDCKVSRAHEQARAHDQRCDDEQYPNSVFFHGMFRIQ